MGKGEEREKGERVQKDGGRRGGDRRDGTLTRIVLRKEKGVR